MNVCLLLAALSLVMAVKECSSQARERELVRQYLVDNNLADLPADRSTAIKLSQQLRQDFNIDESTFKVLDIDNRPFLRHDSEFLLEHMEGTCGQGTRLLINLMAELGYEDVTRLTLYDRFLNPSHTLVSVHLNGEEFLVDTINTQDWFNDFLNEETVSVSDFPIIPYTNSEKHRAGMVKKFREEMDIDGPMARFLNRFFIYSYESTPLSKLSAKAGINIMSFQLERPIPFVSRLAERPHQIMMVLWLGVTAFFLVLAALVYWLKRRIS